MRACLPNQPRSSRRRPRISTRPTTPDLTPQAVASASLESDVAAEPIRLGTGTVRVGTASWTDPTMTAAGVFYPEAADTRRGAAASSTRRRFPVVEVDATYYALPSRRLSELWVERTPPDFVFDIKAHALLTGQPTETKRLPKAIREALPPTLADKARLYAKDLPGELLAEVWRTLRGRPRAARRDAASWAPSSSSTPSGSSPRRRTATRSARRERLARARDSGSRSSSATGRGSTRRTPSGRCASSRTRAIPLVMVDGPQGFKSSIPPVVATTSKDLGRGPVPRPADRDLGGHEGSRDGRAVPLPVRQGRAAEWVPRIAQAAAQAEDTHVLMNNCYANYGSTNARELAPVLLDLEAANATSRLGQTAHSRLAAAATPADPAVAVGCAPDVRTIAVQGFLPSTHGFDFANPFPPGPTIMLGPLDPRRIGIGDASTGLCGGMVMTAGPVRGGADRPVGHRPPENGSPPFHAIVRRQVLSLDWCAGLPLLGGRRPGPGHGGSPHARHGMAGDPGGHRRGAPAHGRPGPARRLEPLRADEEPPGPRLRLRHDADDGVTLRLYDPNWPDRDDVTITLDCVRAAPEHRRAAARVLRPRLSGVPGPTSGA